MDVEEDFVIPMLQISTSVFRIKTAKSSRLSTREDMKRSRNRRERAKRMRVDRSKRARGY
jgi:hypothetical protein